MDIYGISNITDEELNFNYDKYYRNVAMNLKGLETEEEKDEFRNKQRKKLSSINNIKIDIDELKHEFIALLLDEDSYRYLWILYSKYEDGENYIDKLSNILKKENSVIRGGTNTYKMNGWMAHSLYVYQIVNYNIKNNIPLLNFNGDLENKKQVNELHKVYVGLSETSKFVLKIFTLVHDIGVIEDVKNHDIVGVKYVEEVLQEIGITDEKLRRVDINISELVKILQLLIKYHILITSLSSESSDKFVEFEYNDLINNIPNIDNVKNETSKILLLLAYGDVIAVDESLMDNEKYERIQDSYNFFEQITKGKAPVRDKRKVVVQRICDMCGESKVQNLDVKLNSILAKCSIDKDEFIEDMYNLKLLKYTGGLMKTINSIELSIKIYYELMKMICAIDCREALKEYTIIFVPDIR